MRNASAGEAKLASPFMRHPVAVGLAALTLVAAAGCRDNTVRLSYQPEPGDRYAYRIEVEAVSTATLAEQAPRRTQSRSVFEAQHSVLEAGPSGSRVEVRLNEEGGLARTFVVRLDRAAQLAEVHTSEGLPATALSGLGLSEIFPAAAAAPPDRALAPGSRWTIDDPVQVASPEASRLVGWGRLSRLGVVGGREVATVESSYKLPVRRTTQERRNQLTLSGAQDTNASTSYDLEDGSVVRADARTHGTYEIMLLPPADTPGDPIPGTLVVEVRSITRRVG